MKNKEIYNVGFFGDDVWAHKALGFLLKDRSINIKFICGSYLVCLYFYY